MTVKHPTVRQRMLRDPAVQQAYEELAPEYALAREFIAARARAGLSQAEVAARMGTTQSVIARLESGQTLPSMRTLLRFAKAVHAHLKVTLEADRVSA